MIKLKYLKLYGVYYYYFFIIIPKPGKYLTLANSYRPISLLHTISKFFEKLFYNHLKPQIHDSNLYPIISLVSMKNIQ